MFFLCMFFLKKIREEFHGINGHRQCIPSISGTLGDTGVYRHTTDQCLFETGHSPSISKLAHCVNTYIHTHLHVDHRVNCCRLKQNEA